MNNCPACNATISDQTVCRRCKADLGKLLRMEEEARIHEEKAEKAFEESRFYDMFYHARRSCGIKRSPESSKLLASAAMLIGKKELAFSLWSQQHPVMESIEV